MKPKVKAMARELLSQKRFRKTYKLIMKSTQKKSIDRWILENLKITGLMYNQEIFENFVNNLGGGYGQLQ
jgi:DNA polymerase III delta subunit